MTTKILSVSLSVFVGTVLLIMSQNSKSDETSPKSETGKVTLITPSNAKKTIPREPMPVSIQLPPPPLIEETALPNKDTHNLKRNLAAKKKLDITPLKPRLHKAKTLSQHTELRRLKPRKRVVTRPNDEPANSEIKSEKTEFGKPTVQSLTFDDRKNGKTLLRMLEAGKGPSITLSWPSDRNNRETVYSLLKKCHSMKTVIYIENKGLYRGDEPPGSAWDLNPDAVSTFIRRPSGGFSAEEYEVIASINARHSLNGGVPVRIFPRFVDAALLGGIRRLVGNTYSGAKRITADYFSDGNEIGLMNIVADDVGIPGRFVLPNFKMCR